MKSRRRLVQLPAQSRTNVIVESDISEETEETTVYKHIKDWKTLYTACLC